MNTKRVISFTTIALMLCNFVATMPMTAFAAETSNYTYINDNYTIAYNVVDAWDNFENININVYNPTDEPIYHWAFQFDAGGTISNLWNGVIADSNENQYVIENVDYNNVIQPHSSAQLGYIVQFEDEATAPTTFIDCSEAVALTDGFTLDVGETEAWLGGQKGILTLTNTSDRTVYGWKIALESNLAIHGIWNGQLAEQEDGSGYTIHCEEYNSVLAPNASVSIGFIADRAEEAAFTAEVSELTGSVLQYSFEDDSDPNAIRLSGFSQYGINVLNWTYNQDVEYSVYRKAADEDDYTLMETIVSGRYFIDESAEPAMTYSYYVSAPNGEENMESNLLTLKTGNSPETIPEEMPEWMEDMICLEDDWSMLQIGYAEGDSKGYVSHSLRLPDSCANGSSVQWSSNQPLVIDDTGTLTAPYGTTFVPVKMTATLKKGTFSKTRSFDVLVVPQTETEEPEVMTEEDLVHLNAENPDFCVRYSAKTDLVREIEGTCAAFPIANADAAVSALRALKDVLGIVDFENEIWYDGYSAGYSMNSYRFFQYKDDIPVSGCEIFLQVDKDNNQAICVTSNYMTEIPIESTEPTISAEEAVAAVLTEYGGEAAGEPKLAIHFVNPETDGSEPVLVWIVNTKGGLAYSAIVNAQTREIMQKTGGVSDGNENHSERNTLLNEDVTINTHYTGSLWWKTYFLHDFARNIHIKNATGFGEDDVSWAADGTCDYSRDDNDWSDAQYDNAVAASAQLAKTYDHFSSELAWNGYNGEGTPRMYIGVDRGIGNAESFGDKLSFRFSDIENNLYPYLSDIDTVAHEFVHSMTNSKFYDKFSNFPSGSGETGSISEAYSDIFGEFNDPEYDWLHGDKIRVDGTCGRDLIDPESGTSQEHGTKQPAAYLKGSFSSTVVGNEHFNSTVISHAAYLMTQDNETTGLSGIAKDELEKIWFASYDQYTTTSPCFYDCRRAVVKASETLYGKNAAQTKKVKEAFDAVNLLDQDVSFIVLDAYDNSPVQNALLKLTYSDSMSTAQYSKTVWHFTGTNGVYKMTGLTSGSCSMEASKTGYNTTTKRVNVTPELTNYTLYLDSEYNRSLTGRIVIADSDTNPTNNAPLANASVRLEKLSGDGYIGPNSNTKKINTTTDANGNYTFSDIPAGHYSILISYTGYISTQQELTITNTGTTTYNIAIELIPNEYIGKGFASGIITDARTGAKVPGLTLKIYRNIRIGSTEPASTPVCTLTTDANGAYRTEELDAGYYTIYIVDNRTDVTGSRYLLTSFPIKIIGNRVIANQNGVVSTTLDQNQLRIVLTWGDTPSDLDSYLYVRSFTGSTLGYTSYKGETYYSGGTLVADLDLDDITSFGPETTTIYNPVDAMYTFYVHDYTNRGNSSNTALSSSNAIVTVYSSNSSIPIAVFNVPTDQHGTVWKVFTYNNITGEIMGCQTISNSYN